MTSTNVGLDFDVAFFALPLGPFDSPKRSQRVTYSLGHYSKFLVLSVAPLVSSPLSVVLFSRLLPPPVGVRIGKTLVFVVRSCFPSVGVGVGFVCTRETGRWILTRI